MVRHGWVLAAAGLMFAAGTLAAAADQSAGTPPPIDIPPPTAEDGYFEIREQVAPGVHLIRQAEPFHVWPSSNVIAFEQSDGLVLVDAGNSPGAGRRIIKLVKEISPKPVKAIVLTHGHYDHHYGLSPIKAEWPRAKVIATRNTHDYMEGRYGFYLRYARNSQEEERKWQESFRNNAQAFMRNSAKVEDFPTESERAGLRQAAREHHQAALDRHGTVHIQPEVTFTDRYDIPDRDNPLEVRFIGRSNTHGDAIVWAPRARVVAVGDMVVWPVPYGSGMYANDQVATLGRLKQIDFAVLIPGHGLPQRNKDYIDLLIRSIESAKPKVRELVGRGAPIDEINQNPEMLDEELAIFGITDPWKLYFLRRYWARGLMRSLYREMKGEPNEYESDERTPADKLAKSPG